MTDTGVLSQRGRLARAARLVMHVTLGMLAAHVVIPFAGRTADDRPSPLARRLTHWWMRGLCRLLGLRLEIEGAVAAGPVLFVANHISWLDIPALRTAVDADFVSKHDVLDWPAIGSMARSVGTIFLKRGEPQAASLAADRMTWALTQGRSLIVFPEGTTTDGRTVRSFHARLYQAAIRTRARIQPVAIAYPHPTGTNPIAPFIGDDDLVRHLWALLGQDEIVVKLRFCPPLVAPPSVPRRVLADRSRTQIVRALELDEPVDRQSPIHL